MKDSTVVRKQLNFVYHLYDGCNLNCKGCDHFSPISKKGFPSVDKCERDFRRFAEIMNDSITKIGLMGGEPLLNPNVSQYLAIARKYFPKAQIRLVTNGLLLDRQDEIFWDACRENRIEIEYTKYPVKGIDYKKRREIARTHNVTIRSYDGDKDGYIKNLYFEPLDLTGSQDIEKSFKRCMLANNCIQLLDGRLYTCTPAANIFRLSDHYGLGIYPAPEDSLDIFEEGLTKEKVAKFLASPIPLCRFCDLERRTFGHPWRQSQSTVYEYIPFFLDVRAENEIKNYRNVLVYDGGGQYALQVMKWLLNFNKVDDLKLCTDKENSEILSEIHGLKVETFDAIESSVSEREKEKTAVLVAAPKQRQIELERMLVTYGFTHIYLVDTKSLDEKAALATLYQRKVKLDSCPQVREKIKSTESMQYSRYLKSLLLGHGVRKVFWGVREERFLRLRTLLTSFAGDFDFFVDEDPALHGQMVSGLPVLGMDALKDCQEKVFVIVLIEDYARAKKYLSGYGLVEYINFVDASSLLETNDIA